MMFRRLLDGMVDNRGARPHNDMRLGISVDAYRFDGIRNWSYQFQTANGYERVGVLTIVSLRELSVAPPAVDARGAHLGFP